MVIHLWGKFFMAAWRGQRALTWITGAVAFLVSIGTAFTGYLVQQNFDSQWIATQAKDGLNSVGIGACFNVLNYGQMLLWHVLLLPVAVGPDGLARALVRRGVRAVVDAGALAAAPRHAARRPVEALTVVRGGDVSASDQAAGARGRAPTRPLRPGQGARRSPSSWWRCSPCVLAVRLLLARRTSASPCSDGPRPRPDDFVATAAARARRARAASPPTARPTTTTAPGRSDRPARTCSGGSASTIPVDPAERLRPVARCDTVSGDAAAGRRPRHATTRATAPQRQTWAIELRRRARQGARRRPGQGAPGRLRPGADADRPACSRWPSPAALDGAARHQRQRFYQHDYTKPLLFLADGAYLEIAGPAAAPGRRPSGG